jgi:ribosomal protein S18 acetylase RimI-like enzyme
MANVSVSVAPARLEEEAAILPLMVEFNRVEGIAWKPEPMTAALRRLLREPELGLALVARDAASPALAGYAIATFGYDLEFAGRDAFVTELFVSPPFRQNGVGRRLVEATAGALRERGARAVHLMVRPENERARALYARLGFTLSPRILMTREL